MGALIDDAGPLLESSSIPPDERAAWVSSWHIDQVIDPLCPTCVTGDFSLYYPALVARYPSDRMALLSSLQDQTIRQYFMISMGSDYEAHLRALVTDRLVPTSTFRAFLIPGQMHTLLPTIDTTASGSVTLEAWLAQMLAGDPAWVTVGL